MLSSIVWFHMNNNNRNQEGTKREQRKQTDWTWFPSNALSVRAKRFSVVIQINKRLSRWNEMWCLHLFLRIWHSALCWDSHQEALRLLLLYERQQNDIHQHWNTRHETWDMRHDTGSCVGAGEANPPWWPPTPSCRESRHDTLFYIH